MPTPRIEGRIARIMAQMEKLAQRIADNNPRAEVYKTRWLECQQSLQNIRDHGRETIGEAPVGVEIDVPVATFSVKGG